MAIPRLHLFELEDLPGFPALLRDLATDYLQFMQVRLGIHKVVVSPLRDALMRSGTRHIVDLCSGGAGPMIALEKELQRSGDPLRVTLTDRFPNLKAFARAHAESGGAVGHRSTSVDARSVPADLEGFRTIFNGFHHFPPPEAISILRSAVSARQPIGVFDLPERTMRTLVSMLLVPLVVLLTTPWVRPFRWSRYFFTYLVPLVPILSFWDGVVSNLRAYTPQELQQFASQVDDGSYDWEIGRWDVPGAPVRMTYLIGVPRSKGDSP